MSDPYLLQDQLGLDGFLQKKRESEYELLTSLCQKYRKVINSKFKKDYTWEFWLFLKFIDKHPSIDPEIVAYLRESPLLYKIKPNWDVKLSIQAFDWLTSNSNISNYIYFVIDLLKGRFKLDKLFQNFYYLVIPSYLYQEELFCLAVAEKCPGENFRLIVGKIENYDLENSIKITMQELLEEYTELDAFNRFELEKVFIESIDGYDPGNYEDALKKEQPESRPYSIIRLKKESKKLDTTEELNQSENLIINFAEDVLKLKETIERYRKNYLTSINPNYQGLESWKDLLVDYFSTSQNDLEKDLFFSDFNIVWKISVSIEVNDTFKNMGELEFALYLHKIIRFSQGYVIENIETFSNLNQMDNEDFLIIPIFLKNTNLKPIFSVLCIALDDLNYQFIYQLKLINFYTEGSLDLQVKNFKKSGSFAKIKTLLKRPGMKSIILAEHQKVYPIYQLNKVVNLSIKKLILFFCFISQNTENLSFQIISESKEKILASFELIKFENIRKNIYCLRTISNLPDQLKYYLKVINNKSSDFSIEKQFRILSDCKFQFLLDVKIDFIEEIPSIEKRYNFDIYYHLHHYLVYFNKESLKFFDSLLLTITNFNKENIQFGSTFIQKDILEYINSFFLDKIEKKQIDNLYLPLCLLGIVEGFPSKHRYFIKEKNIRRILKMIEKHSGSYLVKFKSKANFKLAIIGLAKVVSLARLFDIPIEFIFITITDYLILSDFTLLYLEFLKVNNVEIKIDEINFILKFIKNFSLKNKILATKHFVEFIKDVEKKIEVLFNPVLDYIPNEDKEKIFSGLLRDFKPTNKIFLYILKHLFESDIISKNLFAVEVILEFMNEHLLGRKIASTEFPEILLILDLIHSQPLLSKFNVKLFLKQQVKKFGFSTCTILFIKTPEFIPELLESVIPTTANNPEWILRIDKEIRWLPENIQEITSLCIFNNLSIKNLKTQIYSTYKANSLILRNSYKKIFKDRILANHMNYDKTLKFLENERSNLEKCDENFILNDLFVEVKYFIKNLKEDMFQRILINPSDRFLECIKYYNRLEKSNTIETIFEFLRKLAQDICNRELIIEHFNHTLKYKPQERNNFFEFIRCAFNKEDEFYAFIQSFEQIEIEVREKYELLKSIKKFICKFSNSFTEIKDSLDAFTQNLDTLRIIDFKLPETLFQITCLLNLPYRSKIFKKFVYKEALKNNKNFKECFNDAVDCLEYFLNEITSNKCTLTLEEVENELDDLDPCNSFEKEIQSLTTFLPNMQKFDKELRMIFFVFQGYKEVKLLIKDIYYSRTPLRLTSKCYKKYFFRDNEFFNKHFLDTITELKQVELEFINKNLILLRRYFSKIAECFEVIKLAYSLGKNELNIWIECINDTLKNKQINLNLIQYFSNLWLFLDTIKDYSQDLKVYLEKIVELLKTKMFSKIIDTLIECNTKVKYLDEFIISLYNQKQVKYNKIRMISQNSIIKIVNNGRVTVEIIILKQDGEYNFDSLSLNELVELKEDVSLSNYANNKIEEKGDIEKLIDSEAYDQFCRFVEKLVMYINIVSELGNSLYKDFLKDEREYFLKDGNFEDLTLQCSNFEKLLNDWKNCYKGISKKSYCINFLSTDIIFFIDRFVFEESEANCNRILKVLKFMNKQAPIYRNSISAPPKDLKRRLELIDQFLYDLKYLQNDVPFPLELKIKNQQEGTILLAETKEFYRGVLSIYSNSQINIPRADLVLFCYLETEWGELKRFINRCMLNPKQELYTLVNPEKLSLENQQKIYSKLSRIILKQRIFCLAIVTGDCKSKFINSLTSNSIFKLKKIQDSMMLTDDDIQNITKKLSKNFVVVTSSYSGLGKTRLIQNVAKKKNVPIHEVSISATNCNLSLFLKIENTFKSDFTLYKFNLDFLSDPEYFDELIFRMAIFNVVCNEQSIIVVPEGSFVYIEIANTYQNRIYNSVQFLKLLRKKNIESFDLNSVDMTEDLIYVCNYLSLLENEKVDITDLCFEINSKNLLFDDKNFCFILLSQYFLPNCGHYPNFHKLAFFIKILTKLFQNLEKSNFYSRILIICSSDPNYKDLNILSESTIFLIKNLIKTSCKLISRYRDNFKESDDFPVEEEIQVFKDLKNTTIIRFENFDQFFIIFLEEDCLSFYSSPSKIPIPLKKYLVYQKIIKNMTTIKKNLEACLVWENCLEDESFLEDYTKYRSKDFISKLLIFYRKFSLKAEPLTNEENFKFNSFYKKQLKNAMKAEYVVTLDNYLKMNLIYLKCTSGLPLIIIGGTGCGKTSLIRFFIENVLRESLFILYVHSGIKVSDIYKHIKSANEEASKQPDQRVWVFFDELNASECTEDIVSVICERRCEGIEIHKSLIFIGALNSHNHEFNHLENTKALNSEMNFDTKYKGRPLPDKAFEFVWNFGILEKNEIRDYVMMMLSEVEMYRCGFFTNMICFAYKYFKNEEDLSVVSLRDAKRFVILYKWFENSIKQREKYFIKKPSDEYLLLKEVMNQVSIVKEILPGLISFMHCFYFRLSSEIKRESFICLIVENFFSKDIKLTSEQILSIIRFQGLDFVYRMNITEEIALNQAFVENIFAIVPCILNKIPVFISGKSGCSKSLAVNFIFSSLRGYVSVDEYFRTLPELQIVPIHAYNFYTSENIEETFIKAEKIMMINENILPIVVFDDINLIGINTDNKINVLHKWLDYENCKVGFIGISNCKLDASTINRFQYLASPDLNEKDLILTAKTLFCTFNEKKDLKTNIKTIKSLAEGYYKMMEYYASTDFPDFFGLKDFYQTIKYVAENLNSGNYKNISSIIQTALYRNFNGLPKSIETLHKYFNKLLNSNYNGVQPINLIKSNLEDSNSRYIMIVCEQDVSEYIKSENLCKILLEHQYFLGSTFENDLNLRNSRFKYLQSIIEHMEQGKNIILQNMDIIYHSLYDLLKRNFSTFSNTKKYCRVGLGAQTIPNCIVHDNFKVIFFVDSQSNILKTGSPLLNIFEKHFIDSYDIIQKSSKEISDKICEWVNGIIKDAVKNIFLSETSVFPIYSKKTINLYILFQGEDQNPKDLEKKCKKFLLQNSSIDLVLICEIDKLNDSIQSNTSKMEKENIIEEWKRLHSLSLVEYFLKLVDWQRYLEKGKRVRMISITYDDAEINLSNQNLSDVIQIEKCSYFKCEEEFRRNYSEFLADLHKVLYVLEFEYYKESHHLRFIINLMESIDSDFNVVEKRVVKNICIIIRHKRSDDKNKPIFLFKNWRYKMFEELNIDGNRIMNEILQKDLSSIVQEEYIFNFETYSEEILKKSLQTFAIDGLIYDETYLGTYTKNIGDLIINDLQLMSIIKEKTKKSIFQTKEESTKKWIYEVLTNKNIVNSATSLKNALKSIIYDKVFYEFTKLLVICEKQSGICSLEFAKSSEIFNSIWIDNFEKLDTTSINVNLEPESNNLNFLIKFRIPFFYNEYKLLKNEYLRLMGCGMSEVEASNSFKQFYLEKMNSNQTLSLFYTNTEIQSYFIWDFIEITLTEELVADKYYEYIYQYLNRLLVLSNKDSYLLTLFVCQEKIILFNTVIHLYEYYIYDNDWILGKLLSHSTFNQFLNSIFDKIIEDISPISENFSNITDIKVYYEYISIIYNSISDLIIDLKPQNFNLLKFWVQLCALNNKNLLKQVTIELIDKSHDYLFTTKFASSLIRIISEELTENEVQMYKFILLFLNKIIKKNSEVISLIVKSFNQFEFWKKSAELIDTIIALCNLKNIIYLFEKDPCSFDEIFNCDNQHLQEIIQITKTLNFSSPFSVLLGSKIELFEFNINCNLNKKFIEIYMDYIEKKHPYSYNLRLLIAVNRVKSYLNKFIELISKKNTDLSISEKEFINIIENALSNRILLVFELYALKVLSRSIGGTLKIHEHCKKTNYKWKIKTRKIKVESDLYIFPISQEIIYSENYKSLIKDIVQLKLDLNQLDKNFDQQIDGFKTFEFGLAFMNTVYLMNTKKNFDKSVYIEWYKQKENNIQEKFGHIFSVLLKFFIHNFPKDSLCYIHNKIKSKDLNIAILISYITLIGISYSKTPNQFSSQFFREDGQAFENIAQNSKDIYYIGAKTRKIQDYLNHMEENFEILKFRTFNKNCSIGGSYICSDACDYFYIMNNCGLSSTELTCRFCKNQIGIKNHKLIDRLGHKQLTDEEAITYLNNKSTSYQISEPKGFQYFSTQNPKTKQRKMKFKTTSSLLNFFTNSVFYLLKTMNVYPDDQLKDVYGIGKKKLNKAIESILIKNYKNLGNKLGKDDLIYWLIESANKFRKVMNEFIGNSNVKQARDEFEEIFEQKIMTQSFFEMSNMYKNCIYEKLEPSIIFKYIEELKFPMNKFYQFTKLFGLNAKPSWASMKREFMLSSFKKDYFLLNYYIQNYDELQNLGYLWPIICFSREMIKECSFEFSRAKAKELKIGDFLVNREHLHQSFSNFTKAWNLLKIELRFNCNIYQRIEVNHDTPLCYLLLDTDINSEGIQLVAAIKTLSEIQNKICYLLPKNKKGVKNYSLNAFSKENIFYLSQENLESIVQKCAIISPEFGKGQEIFYDFPQLLKTLEKYLAKAKMLIIDNLEAFPYKYELLNQSNENAGIFFEIRENFKQLPLNPDEVEEIHKKVEIISKNCNVNIIKVWKQAYNWLGKVISHLRYQKTREEKILEIYNDIKLPDINNLKVQEVFYPFKINQFIDIYELVEVKVYSKIVKRVDEKYKIQLHRRVEAKKSVIKFYEQVFKRFSVTAFIECHNVLKRIIIRQFTSNTDPKHKIKDYFMIKQYWNNEYLSEVENLSSLFIQDYCLEHAIEIEKLFEEKVKNISKIIR